MMSSLWSSTWVRAGIALAVIVAIVAVVVVGRGDSGDAGGEQTPEVNAMAYPGSVYAVCDADAANPVINTAPPVVGEPAPDFALCDERGQFVKRLSDMKGQVVWLNFWATWCVPCKKELPDIQALYDELQDDGLEVLVINYQETTDEALPFLSSLGVTMPAVLDQHGDVYEEYRLAGLPDSFWVDRDGNVAAVYYGFVNEEIARERLAAAGLDTTTTDP